MSIDNEGTRNSGVETAAESVQPRWLGRVICLLLVLTFIAVAGGMSLYWMRNKPKAHRRQPEAQASLVEISPVRTQTERVTIRAMGTVVPTRSIDLASRVGGEIVQVSGEFKPGGRF